MDRWYQDVKTHRYDFYSCLVGYTIKGAKLEEYRNKYSDIQSIPQPTDISYRTHNYNIIIAEFTDQNITRNDYQHLIHGGVADVKFKAYGAYGTNIKWCLYTDNICRDFGRYVKVKYGWVYPLPELTNKQTVSLLEIRSCIPVDLVIHYYPEICYVVY